MKPQLAPLTADHAVPTVVTTDRAIAGPDQPETPEPLNRRGRRHLVGLIRRSQRQLERSLRRQELDERTRHGLVPR